MLDFKGHFSSQEKKLKVFETGEKGQNFKVLKNIDQILSRLSVQEKRKAFKKDKQKSIYVSL